MNRDKHTQNICDAVVQITGRRIDENLSFVEKPDKKTRREEAVDWLY
jgi:hypothetical protein